MTKRRRLTPAGARLFVSDNGTNSELSLILGYNGLGRVTEVLASHLGFLHLPIDLTVVPAFAPGIGDPSPLRLLGQALGGQASWLLTLAMVGLVAAVAQTRRRLPVDRQGQALTRYGWPTLPANAVAFLLAAQVNFALSSTFTWRDRSAGRGLRRRWLAFHVSIASMAVVNMLVFLGVIGEYLGRIYDRCAVVPSTSPARSWARATRPTAGA